MILEPLEKNKEPEQVKNAGLGSRSRVILEPLEKNKEPEPVPVGISRLLSPVRS